MTFITNSLVVNFRSVEKLSDRIKFILPDYCIITFYYMKFTATPVEVIIPALALIVLCFRALEHDDLFTRLVFILSHISPPLDTGSL